MDALACPNCGHRCLSARAKLMLGTARPTFCSSCGTAVGISWRITIVFFLLDSIVPLLAGLLALKALSPFTSQWLFVATFFFGAVLGLLPLLWVYVRFVPLVRRGA